jgi:hypothetical protein
MAEPNNSRPRLSFEQANAICRSFVPVGDELFRYMARLREAGFEAFMPTHEFLESFAQSPDELDLHRRCLAEDAKERLGVPLIRMSDEEVKCIYVSPFLQRLRDERDRVNGVPVRQLSSTYPGGQSVWRREVDPCRRKMIQTEINRRAVYEKQWTAVCNKKRRRLEIEASRYATDLARTQTFDRAGRYAFFSAVMERDSAGAGFRLDKRKSRPGYPIFSKAISDDWDLCWEIEDSQSFFPSPFEGRFAPRLGIRHRELRGSLAKIQSGETLHIRYAGIIPGFFNGYWEFVDLAELETAIKAHLYFYSLMAPIIEEGLQRVLRTATES